MMMRKALFNMIAGWALLASGQLLAQPVPIDDNGLSVKYPFVTTVFNRIFNGAPLDSFYQKLAELKKTGKGVISIVHIGDSHIQADFLSGTNRQQLQQFFGNAGRGLVFPYQLAQSNAPSDIQSSSSTPWLFNRVAHPEIALDPGVSGFAITSNTREAGLNISLRASGNGLPAFNRLKFFLDSSITSTWTLTPDNKDSAYILPPAGAAPYREVLLDGFASGFSLQSLSSDATKAFYGVSLENSSAGIIYHTIGVNGARYDQFNEAPLFWKQLPALNADLYIVSLGTNEAQRAAFAGEAFTAELTEFITKLRASAPTASILITTAPDSYKGRTSNKVLQQLNSSLTAWCNKNYIPLWDLYRITNGYGSAYSWARRGLMSRDRIHFTSDGYRLQGNLLFNALAKGYNDFIRSY